MRKFARNFAIMRHNLILIIKREYSIDADFHTFAFIFHFARNLAIFVTGSADKIFYINSIIDSYYTYIIETRLVSYYIRIFHFRIAYVAHK